MRTLSRWLRWGWRWAKKFLCLRGGVREEVDTLYALLYGLTHDLDAAWNLSAVRTEEAFVYQWSNLCEGRYLLSDPWFKANVARILWEEEIQIRPDWFHGKEVLDAGCGNGRWAFGFAELGAHVTAVDFNPVAVEEARKALEEFPVRKQFYVAPLEELSSHLPAKHYDLVFCWGVLHHCRSFTKAFGEITRFVKDGGLLYLYLYGRESLNLSDDLELFKLRLRYNTMAPQDRYRFLLQKAGGDKRLIHNMHDLYAPLINRRLSFEYVKRYLESAGFKDITRTIRHTELFIRAVKEGGSELRPNRFLPPKAPPFWFQRHRVG